MIQRLEIRDFRGFKHLLLDDLKRVNLLIGGNDTGKTSVLEALVLLLGHSSDVLNLPITFRSNQQGGQTVNSPDDYESFWQWLFRERNPENRISIVCQTDTGSKASVETHFQEEGGVPGATKVPMLERTVPDGAKQIVAMFQNHTVGSSSRPIAGLRVSRLSVHPSHPVEDAEKYNQVALKADGEHRIERVMREIEPRLRRLRYAKLPGTNTPLVYADIGLSRAVPSTQMGQAFNRIFHIYAEILSSGVNVLLIDEIENGIFSESLGTIWKGLLAVCEQENVQIFATTHSRECVIAAHSVADQRDKEELCVQRLQRANGEIEAVRLGGKHLELATELGLEVRS